MIRNYFKIAWRNIMKHKVFSLINIIGLTIGLSASFVISLMIYYDVTFDTFHKDGDRIYRVVSDFITPDGSFHNSGVTLALEDEIADNSNFEAVGGFYVERPMKVKNQSTDVEFKLPKFVIYADQGYFDIFDYNFLAGEEQNVFTGPNQVVLTEKRASQYFPKLSPNEIVGKTLVYNDSLNATVTGIVENFKERTDLVFQEVISRPTLLQTRLRENILNKNWNNTNSNSQLFVKVTSNADLETLQKRLDNLATEHEDEESKKYGDKRRFTLQPIQDIHFNENYGIYDWSNGQASKSLLKNLALVALFLLLLGCINFINLNTAQASQRAKEIGIRKTLGSSKKQLVTQFLGETFLLVLFSSILSLLLSKWLITVFSDFVPKGLDFELFQSPIIISGVVLLLILVTLLSGFYPALVLSRFNTVSVLKQNIGVGDKKVGLRKFLTVFQFTIAQVFIIATLLVGKQINYLLNKDMGFKTDAVVSVYKPIEVSSLDKIELFAEKLQAIPELKKISLGGAPPASESSNVTDMRRMIGDEEIYGDIQLLAGDRNFLELFEIKLLAGRGYRNDTIKELVINEAARKFYGFESPEDAIGKTLLYDKENLPIVGVMSDFHQRSLKAEIRPMALRGDWYRESWTYFQAVHIAFKNDSPESLKTSLSKIENVFKDVYPDSNFRLEFVDETIQNFYQREQKISKLLNWATGLSILISCLGLLGLVIYTTNRRVKEIGVRKVLGASLMQINTLLCKEFLVLVTIAFIVASPIAWYGINNWLQDFVYKTSINFWVFLISGCAMIFFALLVISIKTLQAANANPVNALRSE
ncbi:ABC transporter permease [Psychroserpens ponticola]|uniref:ABC transporter permease n=1 Tax=Psychroserpens ponticola TaxID=2932268 RepID=A0ABY7RZY9_9FLAO|nr:ABC transporter permease [Psychroserpens ponticola]WCO02312.1 ABC transporter permease [Psychroserpens ponticola]